MFCEDVPDPPPEIWNPDNDRRFTKEASHGVVGWGVVVIRLIGGVGGGAGVVLINATLLIGAGVGRVVSG